LPHCDEAWYYTARLFFGHYVGKCVLADTSSQQLEDFVGANFYSPDAVADSN